METVRANAVIKCDWHDAPAMDMAANVAQQGDGPKAAKQACYGCLSAVRGLGQRGR